MTSARCTSLSGSRSGPLRRIKTVEQLQNQPLGELGKPSGLDRAP